MALDKDGCFTEIVHYNKNQDNSKKNDPTFYERLNSFTKHITVEPVAFLALFSSNLSLITSQTLALQKACRVNLDLGDEICESLLMQNKSNNFSSYEKLVQEYYSSQVLWKSTLETLFTCILLLFIGGWSDKTGRRKAVLLFPVLGGTLSALSDIINVLFFKQLPLQVQIFFEVFFIYGTGGFTVTILGLMNYICDITTAENRTHRLGIINLCMYVGIPLGMSLSGIIFKMYGYYAIYGMALTIDIVTVFYVTYRLADPPRSEEQMKVSCICLLKFIDYSLKFKIAM